MACTDVDYDKVERPLKRDLLHTRNQVNFFLDKTSHDWLNIARELA